MGNCIFPTDRQETADLEQARAFVASARELSSYRCAADEFTERTARSTVKRDRNQVEKTKTEYNMNLNRNNSDEGQNGLLRVSNPGSVALTGLAFKIGHGIDHGINPIALKGIGTSGRTF